MYAMSQALKKIGQNVVCIRGRFSGYLALEQKKLQDYLV